MKSLLPALLLLTVSAAFSQVAKVPVTEAEKAIEKSNAVYFDAFRKNDPNIMADRYADDAIIFPPNSEPYKGRQGVLDFYKIGYALGLRNGKFITTEVLGDGKDYVTEIGIAYAYDANGNQIDYSKFMVLWKRTPSGWKMYRDYFSSNTPVGLLNSGSK